MLPGLQLSLLSRTRTTFFFKPTLIIFLSFREFGHVYTTFSSGNKTFIAFQVFLHNASEPHKVQLLNAPGGNKGNFSENLLLVKDRSNFSLCECSGEPVRTKFLLASWLPAHALPESDFESYHNPIWWSAHYTIHVVPLLMLAAYWSLLHAFAVSLQKQTAPTRCPTYFCPFHGNRLPL